MESYLNKESNIDLLEIINFIKESDDYKKCVFLKEKIKKDSDLISLIEDVKVLQKKYIRSNYKSDVKEILDKKIKDLNSNSLFISYNYYLERVNLNIDIIKSELNDYFGKLVNIIN